MDDENSYQNNKDEKIIKHFSVDNEILSRVKKFMKNNDRYNFNDSISDLINLGLADLGYSDKEKALDKISFKGDLREKDIFTIPIDSKKTVYKIIKTLCQKSQDRNAHRTNILIEARAKGISSTKTTEILERLKRNGEIYEPKKDSFKITKY